MSCLKDLGLDDPEVLVLVVLKALVVLEGIVVLEGVVLPEELIVPEGLVVLEGMFMPERLVVREGLDVPKVRVVPKRLDFLEGFDVPEELVVPEGLVVPEVPVVLDMLLGGLVRSRIAMKVRRKIKVKIKHLCRKAGRSQFSLLPEKSLQKIVQVVFDHIGNFFYPVWVFRRSLTRRETVESFQNIVFESSAFITNFPP